MLKYVNMLFFFWTWLSIPTAPQGIVLKFMMKSCTGEGLIRRNDLAALHTTQVHVHGCSDNEMSHEE